MRRPLSALLALLLTLAVPATAMGIRIQTTLTAVEADVMCVVCGEPLAVAQSPEAVSERQYIVRLIRRGETKAQIERQLVAQYGPAVLARPPASGFSLSLYVLPPALVLIGVAILAVTLPRWRARTRQRRAAAATGPGTEVALAPGDSRRLDDELARYGG